MSLRSVRTLHSATLIAALLSLAATGFGDPPSTPDAPSPSASSLTATSATATEVFADFESGTYDGWTLEGDAFGTAPATDALFPGQITGFAGRGFLCSLHPKKGNGATGKATSREFTIEKPVIRFKIGGGNHPNEACMNLVVDNQIVRTATGDDTPTLSDASWDVSALVGKKAHLEVVDSSTSAERGYILVDDIRFTGRIEFDNLPYQDTVMQMADSWISKYHLPGVWCAFIKDRKVVACVADGVKNIETKTPASVDDHLNVGSVSKVITDTMIAEFVSQGVISYSTTVGEVFPSWRVNILPALC